MQPESHTGSERKQGGPSFQQLQDSFEQTRQSAQGELRNLDVQNLSPALNVINQLSLRSQELRAYPVELLELAESMASDEYQEEILKLVVQFCEVALTLGEQSLQAGDIVGAQNVEAFLQVVNDIGANNIANYQVPPELRQRYLALLKGIRQFVDEKEQEDETGVATNNEDEAGGDLDFLVDELMGENDRESLGGSEQNAQRAAVIAQLEQLLIDPNFDLEAEVTIPYGGQNWRYPDITSALQAVLRDVQTDLNGGGALDFRERNALIDLNNQLHNLLHVVDILQELHLTEENLTTGISTVATEQDTMDRVRSDFRRIQRELRPEIRRAVVDRIQAINALLNTAPAAVVDRTPLRDAQPNEYVTAYEDAIDAVVQDLTDATFDPRTPHYDVPRQPQQLNAIEYLQYYIRILGRLQTSGGLSAAQIVELDTLDAAANRLLQRLTQRITDLENGEQTNWTAELVRQQPWFAEVTAVLTDARDTTTLTTVDQTVALIERARQALQTFAANRNALPASLTAQTRQQQEYLVQQYAALHNVPADLERHRHTLWERDINANPWMRDARRINGLQVPRIPETQVATEVAAAEAALSAFDAGVTALDGTAHEPSTDEQTALETVRAQLERRLDELQRREVQLTEENNRRNEVTNFRTRLNPLLTRLDALVDDQNVVTPYLQGITVLGEARTVLDELNQEVTQVQDVLDDNRKNSNRIIAGIVTTTERRLAQSRRVLENLIERLGLPEFYRENQELVDIVDRILSQTDPINKLWLGEFDQLNQRYQNLLIIFNAKYNNGSPSPEFNKKLTAVQKVIQDTRRMLENKPVDQMSLDELLAEISVKNIDLSKHNEMSNPTTPPRTYALYKQFHSFRGPRREAEGETYREYIDRLEKVVMVQVSRAQDINQNEGQIPSCTRADLFPELAKRDIRRDDLIRVTTCHPEYGNQVVAMIRDVIAKVADLKSEIAYTKVCSDQGRSLIRNYLVRNFTPILKAQVYTSEADSPAKDKKIQHIIDVSFDLFCLFDLISVSYLDLMRNTRTVQHGTFKLGVDHKDIDRSIWYGPDRALVHRLQRYDTETDWTAHWLALLDDLPADYGRADSKDPSVLVEYHHKLSERQKEERQKVNAEFPLHQVNSHSDEKPQDRDDKYHGVPFTDLFNPLFPDMLAYLQLFEGEMIEMNGEVYGMFNGHYGHLGRVGDRIQDPRNAHGHGHTHYPDITLGEKFITPRENYQTAEKGWDLIIQLTFGELGNNVTHDLILDGGMSADGKTKILGLIDKYIKEGAGLAKLVPGRHTSEALAPLFTYYIYRMFAAYKATGDYRDRTFNQMVEKLEVVIQGGGLADLAPAIHDILDRIAEQKTVGLLRRKKIFLMRNGLMGQIRRTERKRYISTIYKKRGIPLPADRAVTNTISLFDKISQHEAKHFYAMVNDPDAGLPHPTSPRAVGMYKVDQEQGGH